MTCLLTYYLLKCIGSSIENRRGDLFIEPQNEEFETFVNGEAIAERTQIFNGDRVVIGGSHYFRVSNPHCKQRKNETVSIKYNFDHIIIPRCDSESHLNFELNFVDNLIVRLHLFAIVTTCLETFTEQTIFIA